MDEMRRNTMVGIFMVVGLAAMAWLMTSFGELPALFGTAEHDLIISVENPRGIGVGTPIFLSGVQIGRVKELRFTDVNRVYKGVQIVGAVKEKYIIPETVEANVQPAGIGLGRGRIDLEVPKGIAPPLPKGEIINGKMGSPWGDMIPDTLLASVDETTKQFGAFLKKLQPVEEDLHKLFDLRPVADVDASDAQELTANLSTVIERFDGTLKMFNETFGDPTVREGWLSLFANVDKASDDLRATADTIKNASVELRANLQSISAKLEMGIDDTLQRINEIAADMRPILQNTARLTASLMRIANALDQGQGSAAMLVHDPRLYESLVVTSQRLTELLDTLQRIFRRFEMAGAIKIDVPTSLGTYHKSVDIPDPVR